VVGDDSRCVDALRFHFDAVTFQGLLLVGGRLLSG
jgi:hypothetical protein